MSNSPKKTLLRYIVCRIVLWLNCHFLKNFPSFPWNHGESRRGTVYWADLRHLNHKGIFWPAWAYSLNTTKPLPVKWIFSFTGKASVCEQLCTAKEEEDRGRYEEKDRQFQLTFCERPFENVFSVHVSRYVRVLALRSSLNNFFTEAVRLGRCLWATPSVMGVPFFG